MHPNWMESDTKKEQAKKSRAATKRVFVDRSEVLEDREREEAYQALMENTGRNY